jgi:hypothetical protein
LINNLKARGFVLSPSEDYMSLQVAPPPGGSLTMDEVAELRQRKTEILDLFWFSEPVPPCPFPPDAWTTPKTPRLPTPEERENGLQRRQDCDDRAAANALCQKGR